MKSIKGKVTEDLKRYNLKLIVKLVKLIFYGLHINGFVTLPAVKWSANLIDKAIIVRPWPILGQLGKTLESEI